MQLSILILTVPERVEMMDGLINELNYQAGTNAVEFLWLGDNKRRSVGEKRNNLMDIANGIWLRFLDDDDSIYGGTIKRDLEVIRDNPEKKVICFRGTQNENGNKALDFRFDRRYGRNHRRNENGVQFRGMIPNHLCIWRKDIIKERFVHKNLSEDHLWATAMLKNYTEADQVIIDDYQYHYEFNREQSQCRR